MRRLPLFVLAGLLLAAPRAHAEIITLTTGGLDFDFEGNGFYFAGPGLSARQDAASSLGISFGVQPGCDPCAAGESWNPSFNTSNTYLGTGPATFHGTSYSSVAFYADLNFDAMPVVLPAGELDPTGLQSAFTFAGTLRAFQGTQLAFSTDVAASGQASRYFFWYPDTRQFYAGEERLSYLFNAAPVSQTPEPASLLLLGTGIAGLFARLRRQG